MSKADPAMRVTGRRLPPGMQKPESQSGGEANGTAVAALAQPPTAPGQQASAAKADERYTERARTRAHFSIYTPLYDRARFAVYDLDRDRGYRTTVTEIVNALLHFGPDNAEEMQKLVERFRATQSPELRDAA